MRKTREKRPIPGVYMLGKNLLKKLPRIFSRKTKIFKRTHIEIDIGTIKIIPEIKCFFNTFISTSPE
jgi:hypothetical protein